MSKWQKRPLKDFAHLTKGISYKSEDYANEGEGAIFVTLKCVAKSGGFSPRGIKYFRGAIPEICKLNPGDLLIANTDLTRDGDVVGCPVLLPDVHTPNPVAMSMDLSRIDIDTDDVDTRFLFYSLMMPPARKFMQENASGSTVLHLKTSNVPNLEFWMPPEKREQSIIATVLSTVDRAIEQTEALIAKYQRIKTGMMQDLLTRGIDEHGNLRDPATSKFKDSPLGRIPEEWEVEPIKRLFKMELGKMLSKASRRGEYPKPYLRNQNVQWGRIDLVDLDTMDFYPDEQRRFRLKIDDILICEGGEVGRTALWKGELEECYFQKAIHRLNPLDERMTPQFIVHYMRFVVTKELLQTLTSQTSIAHLTQEKLAELPVCYPKPNEMSKIVFVIEQHDHVIYSEQSKLAKLQRLKTGLMQDLLTGKVSVEPLLEK